MNRLRWLAILMIIAIVGITGFQLYWLRQNYDREKKSLNIKTEMAFREAVLQLQVAKLKLDGVNWEGKGGKPSVRVFMANDGEEHLKVRVAPRQEIVSTINVIKGKLKDSLKNGTKGRTIITLNNNTLSVTKDSQNLTGPPTPPDAPGRDKVFNLLYGVDSLQDSLRVAEIDSAYRRALVEEKLTIPFSITRTDTASADGPKLNEVTIGLANPVTYKLELGNTFPYLMKRITQPVLFSLLLLGITILSFVLLYRNLLKQQRLAELKNEFISNITHELKTPIATVGVAIEALKNFNAIDDAQRTREYLDISSNELQRLSLLVDKVLKLSMFENKAIELKYETADIVPLTNEVIASLKLQLEKRKAIVNVITEGETVIQGDRLHLLSVVFNLLDNALKYSREMPVIDIHITGLEEELIISVADNGIGIPAEYKDRIFDKFFRVPHGDTHNAKGYGLGLSYAARVIQQHKGTIRVTGNDTGGSTFIIHLPKQVS
jgi:two-component system, OmpR family, phosphate regulon sensor histidine kinase PhoR